MTSVQDYPQNRILSLVHGYHPNTYPPAVAYEAGLRFRFAMIFETYRPDKEGMYFDSGLFSHVVSSVCEAVEHDGMKIWLEGRRCLQSFDDLNREYAKTEEDEREPPLTIELVRGKELVGVVETEFWVNVGGPAPYHDSYTASMYTTVDHSADFQRVVEEVSSRLEAKISEVHRGAIAKKPYRPWWSTFARFVGVS